MSVRSTPMLPRTASRYTVFGQIGAGGMASVQYAQFVGPRGFSRPVAIKRLHPHLAKDPTFAALFLEEARLSARIAHANVVATLDVVSEPDEISVVMEYIHGESLAGLLSMARARATPLPYRIASSLLSGVLHGLHAAHETRSDHGEPLGIVHRDVSPENILVGSDGVARLLDFGIAKTKGRARATPNGELKGKLGYMAPEQYDGGDIDRRVDIYGASVVLWEALTARTLFAGANDAAVVNAVMTARVAPPSELASGIPVELDRLVLCGLSRDRDQRFATARQMALALEREVGVATQSEVSDWLYAMAGELLEERGKVLAQLRQRSAQGVTRASPEASTRRLSDTPPATNQTSPHTPRTRTRDTRRRPLVVLGLSSMVLVSGAWLALALHERAPMTATRHSLEPALATGPVSRDLAAPLSLQNAPAVNSPNHDSANSPLRNDADKAAPAERRARKERHTRREAARPAGVQAMPAARGVDCSQPYEIDTLGIRRWKRQCL